MIDFSCPECGKSFAVDESRAGKKTHCPKCDAPLTVPESPDLDTEESISDVLGLSIDDPTEQGGSEETRRDATRLFKAPARPKELRELSDNLNSLSGACEGYAKWILGFCVLMAVIGVVFSVIAFRMTYSTDAEIARRATLEVVDWIFFSIGIAGLGCMIYVSWMLTAKLTRLAIAMEEHLHEATSAIKHIAARKE